MSRDPIESRKAKLAEILRAANPGVLLNEHITEPGHRRLMRGNVQRAPSAISFFAAWQFENYSPPPHVSGRALYWLGIPRRSELGFVRARLVADQAFSTSAWGTIASLWGISLRGHP